MAGKIFIVILLGTLSFFLYKWITVKNNLTATQTELTSSQSTLSQKQQENIELDKTINSLKLEVRFAREDIEHLQQDSALARQEIERLELLKIKQEEQIIALERSITELAIEKTTPEIQQHILRLEEIINNLREERNRYAEEKNEANRLLERKIAELREKEREMASINEVVIPYLNGKIDSLKFELARVPEKVLYSRIKGEITDIAIDFSKNELRYNLVLDEDELSLITRMRYTELSFSPVIENISGGIFLNPAINDFQHAFKIRTSDLKSINPMAFQVNNVNLAKTYKRKSTVNLEQGDKIKILLRIDEMDQLEIANSIFYLRK